MYKLSCKKLITPATGCVQAKMATENHIIEVTVLDKCYQVQQYRG